MGLWGRAPRHTFGCHPPTTLNKPSGGGVPGGPWCPTVPSSRCLWRNRVPGPRAMGCHSRASRFTRDRSGPKATAPHLGIPMLVAGRQPGQPAGDAPVRLPRPKAQASFNFVPLGRGDARRPAAGRAAETNASGLCSKPFFAFAFLAAYFRLFLPNAGSPGSSHLPFPLSLFLFLFYYFS